jgi:hypothetical protein
VQNTARYFIGGAGVISTGTRAETFFISFVDAIFTTLLERLFTNAFDLSGVESASDCLCRARHAG